VSGVVGTRSYCAWENVEVEQHWFAVTEKLHDNKQLYKTSFGLSFLEQNTA
jgi:hypothetical protein